jgi:hypothetical protein
MMQMLISLKDHKTEKQKIQKILVPLPVLVDALLPETLQFLKITKSPDTFVAPADTFDLPLTELKLQRLGPMTKDMLPPQT